MATPSHIQKSILSRLTGGRTLEELKIALTPKLPSEKPLPPRLPGKNEYTRAALDARRRQLTDAGFKLDALYAGDSVDPESLRGNIEEFIGFAQLPVGIIGPLRVNGTETQGDFFVPLATSEGALVASYNRGAQVISASGGATTACMTESVSRAPAFVFAGLTESCHFVAWTLSQLDWMRDIVTANSRFCRLQDLRTSVIGKEVYLIFDYSTGDAAGQNMVTIATQAVCEWLIEHSPVKPSAWYIDGNLSGDKKATMASYLFARGKKVVSEVIVPREIVSKALHTTAEQMLRYWEISFMGGTQSGSIGAQGHFANGLAALFIACGQDAACVSEAAIGITRMDVVGDGALYASVTLPNLIVGTVGGGTGLPTASQCLQLLGCAGAGHARKFAEICAATVLAGELSMIAALTHGDFVSAHAALGRKKEAKA